MTDNKNQPEWFKIGDALLWPLIGIGVATARAHHLPTVDLQPSAQLALCHHAGCMEAGIQVNQRGKHSAAICLIRQSVEALTIAEIGLQPAAFAEPLLAAWKEGNKSHGELRKALERDVWPSYGVGLWDESWAEFHGNLARAVQPYAHYTSELQGWQFTAVADDGGREIIEAFGLESYDPLKATRITLLHMLLTWMLGRILLAHGKNPDALERRDSVVRLGCVLGSSKLLFKRGQWGSQLHPHVRFKPGHDWRDDA